MVVAVADLSPHILCARDITWIIVNVRNRPTEATALFGYIEQNRNGTELRFGDTFSGVK